MADQVIGLHGSGDWRSGSNGLKMPIVVFVETISGAITPMARGSGFAYSCAEPTHASFMGENCALSRPRK
jgi:hypothetical protein